MPSADNLRIALVELASDGDRGRLEALLGRSPWNGAQLAEALAVFSAPRCTDPVLILLDNLEDGLDPGSGRLLDWDLARFLSALAYADDCAIKVVITSRRQADELLLLSPAVFTYLPLQDGLPSPYAEELLRALDSSGTFGLRDASNTRLGELRAYTRGFPRALEAVFSLLITGAQLDEIGRTTIADDLVVEALVGEALRRLDDMDQLVVGVLAVFGRPVPAAAIDFVLGRWFDHIDAARVLVRLYEMRFVQRASDSYTLHPVDAANAIRVLQQHRWPTGRHTPFSDGDRNSEVSLATIKGAAADYYTSVRRNRTEWKSMQDVEAYLGEFKLRIELNDDWTAAQILEELSSFFDKQGAFKASAEMSAQLEAIADGGYAKWVALRGSASAAWRLGRVKESVAYQKRLIEELEKSGRRTETERANLAIYEIKDGQYFSALAELERFQREHLATDFNSKNAVVSTFWIAELKEKIGYLDDALAIRRKALDMAVKVKDVDGIEAQTHNLASTCEELNMVDETKQLLADALVMAETTGNPLWKANHLGLLASVLYGDDDNSGARRSLDEAIAIREEIFDLDGLADNLLRKARWNLLAGDVDGAELVAATARDAGATGSLTARNWQGLFAEVAMCRADWRDAERQLRQVLASPMDGWTCGDRTLLGYCLLGQAKRDEAGEALDTAAKQARQWIERCGRNSAAWAGLGAALAGSSVLGTVPQEKAAEAYAMARKYNPRPGYVARRLHDLRLLALARPDAQMGTILRAVDGVDRPTAPEPAMRSVPNPQPPGLGEATDKAHADREALAEVIARRTGGPTGESMGDLVLASNLPQNLRFELLGQIGGNVESSARRMIRTLLDYGTVKVGGNAALGNLLLALMPRLGVEDVAFVGALLLSYGLIGSRRVLADLCSRYQFPQAPDVSSRVPPVWDVPFAVAPAADDLTLQSWLAREPDFLDLGTLRSAVARARSVCRIDVPALGGSGTGILLNEDLVLTNYHVLAGRGSSPETNTEGVVVRFGAFTDSGALPDDGQPLKLHSRPVIARSPTDAFDFVLLRTARQAIDLADVAPLKPVVDTPQLRGDLHILQHPQGGSDEIGAEQQ